jgi:hypothetical protein
MGGRNHKQIIMGRNKEGILRAISREHPSLDVCFGLLNQFLCFTTLSLKNTQWAAAHVQTLRAHPDFNNDVAAQDRLDRLERAVADAKARWKRREEKRERQKTAAEPKVDRRLKPAPPPPPEPAADPSKIWAQALEEKKS